MGVAQVQFFSDALGKSVSYNAIVPERGDGPFPVLLQLHGLSDDHHAWIQRSNLVRYAEKYQLIVILPDGGTSRYLNWPHQERWGKQRYEELLARDIPGHVSRIFRVKDGPWAIGGLSMGGFGGMRLGVKYPEQFASIWVHSSVFQIDPALKSAVADGDDAEILPHIEALKTRGSWPSIAFDCGVDDFLIDQNRWLHSELNRLGVDHIYREHPGAHTWEYWDEHVQTALAHHASVLGIEPAPERD
jgi:S-formylglutathione hydrolase FrmB